MPLIDFETKSALDLSKCGAYRYADPRYTAPICMAWKSRGEQGVWWPEKSVPRPIVDDIQDKCVFWAHNAEFDRLIWEKVLGWPKVAWGDSMALAAANGFPLGLDQCAIALGMDQKDKVGRAAMLKMGRTPFPDTPQLRVDCGRYAFHDIEIMEALIQASNPLSPFLRQLYETHCAMNARGIAVDVASVHRIQTMLGRYIEAKVRPIEAQLGFRLSQVAVLLNWLNERGACLANMQADNLERWLAQPCADAFMREVVQARLLAGLASVKKFDAMIAQVSHDDRLRGQYQFLTAKSGRFSSKGVQIHNLLRDCVNELFFELLPMPDAMAAIGALLGDPFEQCSKALRQTFTVAPGNELTIGDYAQIELRIILWLCGDYAQLDRLAAGNDLYVELARDIYNDPTIKKGDERRNVGKKGKLSCGYGTGAAAFQTMCLKEGLDLTFDLCQRVITIYRATTPRVPALWDAIDECCEMAMSDPWQDIALAMVEGGPELVFRFDRQHLTVKLPSGRSIVYRDARIDGDGLTYMGVDAVTHQWSRQRIWGSAMTGHIVQGIAACLLHEAMVRLNAQYNLVLHTHDECGVEAPIGLIDQKAYGAIMEIAPAWAVTKAKALPIKVDVNQCVRYKKG